MSIADAVKDLEEQRSLGLLLMEHLQAKLAAAEKERDDARANLADNRSNRDREHHALKFALAEARAELASLRAVSADDDLRAVNCTLIVDDTDDADLRSLQESVALSPFDPPDAPRAGDRIVWDNGDFSELLSFDGGYWTTTHTRVRSHNPHGAPMSVDTVRQAMRGERGMRFVRGEKP